jgi:hypothetical protein
MNKIFTSAILALPFAIASLATQASALEINVNSSSYGRSGEVIVAQRYGRRVWVPGHYVYTRHGRVWIRGHYQWVGNRYNDPYGYRWR